MVDHRQLAQKAFESAEESFRRSDTDGFLSQWASNLSGQMHQKQAEIDEAGGVRLFPGLFDEQGRRVKAKLVEVVDRYRGFGRAKKEVWLVLDANDKALAWVPRQSSVRYRNGKLEHGVKPSPRSKMAALQLHEAEELAPAKAVIDGSGHGLSGNAWVAVKRLDKGYPEGSVIYGAAASEARCPDCGEAGHGRGWMECQYPR